MKPKLVLHTKITGEHFLSISSGAAKIAEIPMGTSQKIARKKAQEFIDIMKAADVFTDQTS